jgi:putative iron-regulated protein
MDRAMTVFVRSRVLPAAVCAALLAVPAAQAQPADAKAAVIEHYADAGAAIYADALSGAQKLQDAVDGLLVHPTPQTLDQARAAWRQARVPYLQSEAYRFANAVVDEWEPKVNAWPVDEGLIDYVAPAYGTSSDQNPFYAANVIANRHLDIGGEAIDATIIDKPLLRRLQQAEGVQTNVATGYHAIEFLLWGQDLHGVGPGAGERPAGDYDLEACAHAGCDRRAAYLRTATALLVDDLAEMAADWKPGGKARAELQRKGPDGGLAEIVTGMGALSFGEMAGERMKLGLMLHDPEEEQDCFSDNTQNSHFYDEAGIIAAWTGRYRRPDGSVVEGPGLRAYAMGVDPASARRLDQALEIARTRIAAIKQAADGGRMAYDQMLAPGNAEGGRLIQDAMDGLALQTRAIEGVALALHLPVTGVRGGA